MNAFLNNRGGEDLFALIKDGEALIAKLPPLVLIAKHILITDPDLEEQANRHRSDCDAFDAFLSALSDGAKCDLRVQAAIRMLSRALERRNPMPGILTDPYEPPPR